MRLVVNKYGYWECISRLLDSITKEHFDGHCEFTKENPVKLNDYLVVYQLT